MRDFELIKQGAEARIYRGVYLGKNAIAKERFEKKYRHPDLDKQLTKERIKAESRAIVRCKLAGIITPSLYLIDFKRNIIFMEYIEHSETAKDFINGADEERLEKLSLDIGNILGRMHLNNIIHGDLTSSNILVKRDKQSDGYSLVLIDFGLAFIDSSAEDKGVDLYVLERALLSTHSVAENMFPVILKGYKEANKNYKEIFVKYEEVRARGRKRTMVG